MKRSTFLMGLFAVLSFTALSSLAWARSAPSWQTTPTVIEDQWTSTPGPIDGFIARLFLNGIYQDFVCYPAGMEPSPTWETTATPLPTALPPTRTPSSTPLVTPAYTPTPTATPIPLCTGTTTANLNVRSGPGYVPGTNTFYPNLINADGSKLVYLQGFEFAVMGWVKPDSSGIWLKTAVKSQTGYVSAAYVTLSAGCAQEFPTYPF